MRKCLVLFTLSVFACAVAASPAAAAVPKCEGPVSQKTLYSGQGLLEAAISGGGGKLFVSGIRPDESTASLLVYDRPGSPPRLVASAGPGAGGLTWMGRRLLWGNGNTIAGGQTGDEDPQARLLRVHPQTGRYSTWATGLGMANGVTRTREGVVFASNDFGMKLDRISPRGVTNHGWAEVESGNGMVVGRNGKFLLVAQTFVVPGTIASIEIGNPSNVRTYYSSAGTGSEVPAFDGLARDNQNNLYVTAWATGEVWKITPERKACVLATGMPQVSNVAFGGGRRGFARAHLYAVNFLGDIVQVMGARRATVPE